MIPLTDPDEVQLTVDYRRDFLDIYKQLPLALFSYFLDYLTGCQNPSHSNNLPSWVPNLAIP